MKNASIERAYIDKPSSRQTLIETNLRTPMGLALDSKNELLYFCDSEAGKIEVLDMKTMQRSVLLWQPYHEYHDLSIMEEELYYTDGSQHHVAKINRFDKQPVPVQVTRNIFRSLQGIRVIDRKKYAKRIMDYTKPVVFSDTQVLRKMLLGSDPVSFSHKVFKSKV